MNESRPSILIVDDEPMNIRFIAEILKDEDYKISIAVTGEEAWNLLDRSPDEFDAVLLDRTMPGIDGMEVLLRMKQHDMLKTVPVIFQTARTKKEDILEGIQAGAYYYLTKPYEEETLRAVVKTSIADHEQFRSLLEETQQTIDALAMMRQGCFEPHSLEDVNTLAALLAKICPDPDKVVLGLWELMLNALEHGNLGISYDEKSSLVNRNQWRKEVDRRLSLPENASKTVSVSYNKSPDEITFLIEDMGNGFDWRPYLEMSYERVFDAHGRGIAIASIHSFDTLEYLGSGNRVRAVINLGRKED